MLLGEIEFLHNCNDELLSKVKSTEFSKSGLEEFHRETGKYLIVTLIDGGSALCFDKSGTFPEPGASNDVQYSGTGGFKGLDRQGRNKVRRATPSNIVKVVSDVQNMFDAINFFEAEKDLSEIFN